MRRQLIRPLSTLSCSIEARKLIPNVYFSSLGRAGQVPVRVRAVLLKGSQPSSERIVYFVPLTKYPARRHKAVDKLIERGAAGRAVVAPAIGFRHTMHCRGGARLPLHLFQDMARHSI